jgi:hypothetical protein
MNLEQRKRSFVKLGEFFQQFNTAGIVKVENKEFNSLFFDAFSMQIERASESNAWFTRENVLQAFQNWSKALRNENLNQWIGNYEIEDLPTPKTIAIIMAGNIPLVGFHDFLCALICGHKVKVKLSSNDPHFLPLIAKFLEYFDDAFKGRISFSNDKLNEFDAVLATGSSNTARYFDYYFGKYPNIIRKNRNSIAVISGEESPEELEKLGDDIFQYFGLGCRSVSKLFVPKNYNFDHLFNALFKFKDLIHYKKYENNYDYNKAVYLMSSFKILENGFLMLKEDPNYSSPIATLFYESYDSIENLKSKLHEDREQIQCIVSNLKLENQVDFGEAQNPKLWDYADGIDTLQFLIKL